ncbi:MAG TPA: TetR/AcrR family transcriptional regulator [Caulobacteraceae bacterium]|jgi:AcrR family transcriptional regulator
MMENPAPRRRATQARSRATVERILASAAALTAERGPDAATMTEIARRAEVVIGSLYQYFPDKAGVMAALFERHSAGVHEMLLGGVEGAASLEDLSARVEDLSERYFALHRDDAVVRGIWAVVQTDPALQALDVADSLRNAEALFRTARPLYRKVDDDRLMATCALAMQLALSAARFALAIPQPLSALSAGVFAHMVRGAFLALEEG